MSNIVEIVPDDLPDWARDAFDQGQFFNIANKAMKTLDRIEQMIKNSNTPRPIVNPYHRKSVQQVNTDILTLINEVKNENN